jgi:CRP-like cAMP-binding protein
MGGGSTPSRGVVQSAGEGYRLKAELMREEFNKAGPVLHLLLRYTQALITQMSQTAVCNRHHSLDQQLCRWLLLSLDRLQGNVLVMTQELIANMLGVRREGVTEAALKLQKAGLIRYARGHITVLNRKGVQARSCECYRVVKREYDRLLPARLAT